MATNTDARAAEPPTVEVADAEPTAPNKPSDSGDESQWESESLFEDLIEAQAQNGIPSTTTGPDVCTPEEVAELRHLFRTTGEDQFIDHTLRAGRYTAKKLCSVFGILPPAFLEGAPDHAYNGLLEVAINRFLEQRQKLPQYNTVEDAVSLLKSCKNIVVLTGAGISTSLGIPDFRSKDTGLYSQLEHLGLDDPQQVFDIEIFREDPTVFYSIAKDIFPASTRFSPTHAFIRLLQDQGKLLTNFTQNIDNLESHAGITQNKLVQCHGSFATATCLKCNVRVQGEDILKELKSGTVARCRSCLQRLNAPGGPGLKRKRSSNSVAKQRKNDWEDDSVDEEDYAVPEAGIMKPDITFFGEALPSTFHDRLIGHDRDRVDLVIVIGTSLNVAPVARVPSVIPPNVPQIFISRGPCRHISFDIELLGECDAVIAELCQRAGWALEHEMVPKDVNREIAPFAGHPSRWYVKTVGSDGASTVDKQGEGAERAESAARAAVQRLGSEEPKVVGSVEPDLPGKTAAQSQGFQVVDLTGSD